MSALPTGKKLKLAGGIFQALGNIGQGREADEVSELNAMQLRADADVALQQSRKRAFGIQRAGQRLVGRQRASTAARGVVVGRGSALDLITETITNTNLRAAEALKQGQLAAIKKKNQAEFEIRKGNAANRAGLLLGVSSLLNART